MPLSSPICSRTKLHDRDVEVSGYLRDDGLYEIEGSLCDTKTYTFLNRWRGEIPVGEPLHGMSIRLTLTKEMRVHDIEAVMDFSPYPDICPAITPNFSALKGKQIGQGWQDAVKLAVGREKGCTHLVELLLGPVSTTAYITIFLDQKRKLDEAGKIVSERPGFINTCHSLQADGEVIKHDYPQYYEGD